MSYREPTTAEIFASFLAQLESALGQDSPINDKAFLRVLAVAMAGMTKGLYKLGSDAAQQNLALTASGEGLDRIGIDNNTPRKSAENAVLTATLPATTGTVIPATTDFYADATGLRYRPTEDATSVAGVATLSLRCIDVGTSGNLEISDTLQIGSPIAGSTTIATVTAIDTLGVDQETDADYRPRVLFIQRAFTGGGNATDHKIWSEAVIGVRRAFPYSGRPDYAGASYPGDRTVYIECNTSIESDGIPPGSLIDDVRDAINTDPDTGESRATLGLTDATLWVEPISRTAFYVQITTLAVEAAKESACKSALTDAIDDYLRTITPYVEGVDVEQERSDSITNTSLGQVVQDVLSSYGANCQGVAFGVSVGVFVSLYLLDQGELAKLASGGISYV